MKILNFLFIISASFIVTLGCKSLSSDTKGLGRIGTFDCGNLTNIKEHDFNFDDKLTSEDTRLCYSKGDEGINDLLTITRSVYEDYHRAMAKVFGLSPVRIQSRRLSGKWRCLTAENSDVSWKECNQSEGTKQQWVLPRREIKTKVSYQGRETAEYEDFAFHLVPMTSFIDWSGGFDGGEGKNLKCLAAPTVDEKISWHETLLASLMYRDSPRVTNQMVLQKCGKGNDIFINTGNDRLGDALHDKQNRFGSMILLTKSEAKSVGLEGTVLPMLKTGDIGLLKNRKMFINGLYEELDEVKVKIQLDKQDITTIQGTQGNLEKCHHLALLTQDDVPRLSCLTLVSPEDRDARAKSDGRDMPSTLENKWRPANNVNVLFIAECDSELRPQEETSCNIDDSHVQRFMFSLAQQRLNGGTRIQVVRDKNKVLTKKNNKLFFDKDKHKEDGTHFLAKVGGSKAYNVAVRSDCTAEDAALEDDEKCRPMIEFKGSADELYAQVDRENNPLYLLKWVNDGDSWIPEKDEENNYIPLRDKDGNPMRAKYDYPEINDDLWGYDVILQPNGVDGQCVDLNSTPPSLSNIVKTGSDPQGTSGKIYYDNCPRYKLKSGGLVMGSLDQDTGFQNGLDLRFCTTAIGPTTGLKADCHDYVPPHFKRLIKAADILAAIPIIGLLTSPALYGVVCAAGEASLSREACMGIITGLPIDVIFLPFDIMAAGAITSAIKGVALKLTIRSLVKSAVRLSDDSLDDMLQNYLTQLAKKNSSQTIPDELVEVSARLTQELGEETMEGLSNIARREGSRLAAMNDPQAFKIGQKLHETIVKKLKHNGEIMKIDRIDDFIREYYKAYGGFDEKIFEQSRAEVLRHVGTLLQMDRGVTSDGVKRLGKEIGPDILGIAAGAGMATGF